MVLDLPWLSTQSDSLPGRCNPRRKSNSLCQSSADRTAELERARSKELGIDKREQEGMAYLGLEK